jgi:hypothetical protein
MFPKNSRVWNHRFGYGEVRGRCAHLYYIRFDSGVYSNESAHYLLTEARAIREGR